MEEETNPPPTSTGTADAASKQLLAAARAGDAHAYRRLFDGIAPRLWWVAVRRLPRELRRKVSVADLLQEAMWAAWRRLDDFEYRGPGSFLAWVARIVEHKAGDAVRHFSTSKRAAGREADATPSVLGVANPPHRFPTASQHAIASELEDRLRAALSRLPADYRMVLHLVHVEGCTLDQAGERMGRSRAATQKLFERAKNKLWESCRPDDST